MSKPERPATRGSRKAPPASEKIRELDRNREDGSGEVLTTNQGLPVNDNQNSLKAGERGPTLLEDFLLREKITHFDHERIPERVVHARGSAAHGYFQVYEPMAPLTKAGFLQNPGVRTPVFVRFSTVAGSRGSTDLARDARGFAVKFYTDEGNFDLVGNNIPVFFIQDAIKFPDLVHAVKPEPNNEMPQAASAHDTFWDFISLMPESMHMIMWVMSDRAIPRSYRMMEGFGVHTFRFVNEAGKSRFVKFHWKPLLGVHSVAWDEAQIISGKDSDFHRRDLWESIEAGAFPQWELGVQIVEEKDEHAFDFDLLDPTKLIPEELVPVRRIGLLTLDRNPDNFFAETEQVAFHPGHIVPGIDFSNDSLLQGRLFSYTDTQLLRLGGPNFHEIPINRPVAAVHNNQRDGHMRQTINQGRVSYEPNTLGGGCPMQATRAAGGFVSHPESVDGPKVRARSEKFFDHFSQATLFWNSQSTPEKNHLVSALQFELGKLTVPEIRGRMVGMLSQVDRVLAERVAAGLGIAVPKIDGPLNLSVPADGNVKRHQPRRVAPVLESSAALSMAGTISDTVSSRMIAFLVADGVDADAVEGVRAALTRAGAKVKLVAPRGGAVAASNGASIPVDATFLTASSVLFDAVYVPGAEASAKVLSTTPAAIAFVAEAYKHCKAIGATGAGERLLSAASILDVDGDIEGPPALASAPAGVVVDADGKLWQFVKAFLPAIAAHRHWTREEAPPS
jgi:catalase